MNIDATRNYFPFPRLLSRAPLELSLNNVMKHSQISMSIKLEKCKNTHLMLKVRGLLQYHHIGEAKGYRII